jgi:hypothetical protein
VFKSAAEIIEEMERGETPAEDPAARELAERVIREFAGDIERAYAHLIDTQALYRRRRGDRELANRYAAAARWLRSEHWDMPA